MMKKYFQKHFVTSAVLALAFGLVSCNLFNPTESVNIKSNDAEALTYQGYLHYQKNEYSLARDYFEKAIKADSAYSEAWYGRAKAVLNLQEGLNILELISYAKSDDAMDVAENFMNMPDEKANQIKDGLDSVFKYIDPFIVRDELGLTDKRVRFKDFSDSYAVMQMTKLALTVRAASVSIKNIFSAANNILSINWAELDPEELGETAKETFDALASTATAIKANPELVTTVIKEYIPDSLGITDSTLTENIDFFADQIIYVNDAIQKTEVDRALIFLNVGNVIDDDGDGCIDEEIPDGQDNDGDGEIDEDMRHYETYVMDIDSVNHLNSNPTKVREIKLTERYNFIDIDGNGIFGEEDENERIFVIQSTRERESKNNHLFRFADSLKWVGTAETAEGLEKRIAYKDSVRLDTDSLNYKYDLEWRKKHVGGCWNNYDEEAFKAWFRGRE
ncbi:MAG: tetratricopeptide repeat protein [Fibrobacter sp.]|nr:tetratricopeptide repeat protein [Fibrobacter sp.]